MNNTSSTQCTCGCFEGLTLVTPEIISNMPGLSALLYRVGTHGSFKESMLTGLSRNQALSKLTTRDDDDPAIALLDGWAAVLDVLSFYQERIANEGYLRTATERRSILELAHHISYRLNPGLAAETFLAFTMDSATGSPPEARIPAGTRVQSVPGQNQLPQIFETTEEIVVRQEWNAIVPVMSEKQIIDAHTTTIYLKGTDNQLKPGDSLLIVDKSRETSDPHNENWDLRILHSVEKDNFKNITIVTFKESLGQYSSEDDKKKGPRTKPASNPLIYTFRQRASLFGYNAPDWLALPDNTRIAYLNKAGISTETYLINSPSTWNDNWPAKLFKITFEDKCSIYLDALYPGILKGSWIVLEKPDYEELYKAEKVVPDYRSEFTISSKSTRIDFDTDFHLDWFSVRNTIVHARSEPLEIAEKPVSFPVTGNCVTINGLGSELKSGQRLIITGKLLKQVIIADRKHEIRVGHRTENFEMPVEFNSSTDGGKDVLKPGEKLEISLLPEKVDDNIYKWFLLRSNGIPGYVLAGKDDLIYKEKQPGTSTADNSTDTDQIGSEDVIIKEITRGVNIATVYFTKNLTNIYQRDSVVLNANVVRATHGETKSEILGSGNAAAVFQQFDLKQKPLTFISSVSATGALSTLQIRVNDILWKEIPSFYSAGSYDRVYITRIADGGKVTVQFGDGITGSRLPTGTDNVKASYRVGTGLAGLLEEKKLSLLLTPQLGVKTVINPRATEGAGDPETLDSARQNAPLTVLTLDRIVSLLDYECFTQAFSGVGKARVDFITKGEQKVIHLTIASANGKGVDASSNLYNNLTSAIDRFRDSNIPVKINSYKEKWFDLKAKILIDSMYLADKVKEATRAALLDKFSFNKRSFGEGVSPSEIISVIQGIPGVISVDLDELGGSDPFEKEHFHLKSGAAEWTADNFVPAELLLINPDGISIEEMEV